MSGWSSAGLAKKAMNDRATMIVAPLARWSSRIALFSASVLLVDVVLHRLTPFPTPVAVNLFAVGVAGGGLAVLVGLIALIQIWRKGYGGAGSAALGVLLPFIALAWPLTYVPAYLNLPPINDVTTDLASPPQFRGAGQAAHGRHQPGRPIPAQRFAARAAEGLSGPALVRHRPPRAGGLRARRGGRAQAQVAGRGLRAAGDRARGQARHARGDRHDAGGRLHRRHRRSRGGQRQPLAHRRALRLALRPSTISAQTPRACAASSPSCRRRIDSTSPGAGGRRGLRTTRAGAMVKKAERERSKRRKAEARSGRARVQSSAQRERAQKETQR